MHEYIHVGKRHPEHWAQRGAVLGYTVWDTDEFVGVYIKLSTDTHKTFMARLQSPRNSSASHMVHQDEELVQGPTR